jgi:hypothetical protein
MVTGLRLTASLSHGARLIPTKICNSSRTRYYRNVYRSSTIDQSMTSATTSTECLWMRDHDIKSICPYITALNGWLMTSAWNSVRRASWQLVCPEQPPHTGNARVHARTQATVCAISFENMPAHINVTFPTRFSGVMWSVEKAPVRFQTHLTRFVLLENVRLQTVWEQLEHRSTGFQRFVVSAKSKNSSHIWNLLLQNLTHWIGRYIFILTR